MTDTPATWSLHEALKLSSTDGGQYTVRTHAAFWTMIGPFGGWSAAVALKAARVAASAEFEPVTLSAHFAGAIQAGDVEVVPTLTRRNRGTEFWRCQLRQDDACAVDTHIVFARRRPTLVIEEHQPPSAPPPETLETTEFAGIPWTTTYDCRFVTSPPMTDSGSMRSVFWVRLRHPEPVTFESLVALCDACVPRAYFRTDIMFPSSTISMNVQLHADAEQLHAPGHPFVLVEANGSLARKGFFDQHLRLWSSTGELLATSEQLFWFKLEA